MRNVRNAVAMAIAIAVAISAGVVRASVEPLYETNLTAKPTDVQGDSDPVNFPGKGGIEADRWFGTVFEQPAPNEDLLNESYFTGYEDGYYAGLDIDPNDTYNWKYTEGGLGLFGSTEWQFLAKVNVGDDESSVEYAQDDFGLTLVPDTGDPEEGTWSVNSDAWAGTPYDHLLIVLKAGPYFGAYAFVDFEFQGNLPTQGTWDTSAFLRLDQHGNPIPDSDPHALSHFAIFVSPEFDRTFQVIPEPTSVAIWSVIAMAFVCGSSMVRRRRRFVTAGTPRGWTPESRTAIRQVIERGRHG